MDEIGEMHLLLREAPNRKRVDKHQKIFFLSISRINFFVWEENNSFKGQRCQPEKSQTAIDVN
jgi:hypothetical protein